MTSQPVKQLSTDNNDIILAPTNGTITCDESSVLRAHIVAHHYHQHYHFFTTMS